MNAVSLPIELAWSNGAEMWVIKDDPTTKWWPKLDLRSCYLLSENYFRPEKTIAEPLKNIIEATNLDVVEQSHQKNYVLLGTSDHFLNKWVLVWNNLTEGQVAETIEELSTQMKFSSVRFFSHSETIIQKLETRPSASSLNISFIENT